uniref:InlB B-repeat-containing protein n=1 Tax=Ruminococcus sp. TaxID=41978 RepID=UPI00386B2007
GADCIATVNDTTNTGTGAWPGGTGWDTANRLNVNGATATPGVYQIKVKTAQTDKTINIGLYQMSANLQRGYKLGDTYYNTVGADYEVPNSGVADSDNLYIVTGTGSIILAPDTEYTITIDQTQPLNASNPFGKITITTNKADISAIARVKKFNISTGQPSDEITNAPAYIGTAVADPSTGTIGFTTTLTATAGAGYSFDGWYTNEDCTQGKVPSATRVVSNVSASAKYYALFTEDAPAKYSYNVTTDGNGTAGAVSGTGVFNDKVYKGGNITFDVTPNTGYILDEVITDSGVATHNGNKVTVSGFNKNFNVTVKFKQIETWKLNINLNTATYGSVSAKYYSSNGVEVTVPITSNTQIAAQKDKPVTLTATAKSTGEFTGWTLENGKYQRSKNTPLSAKEITILPSADQTITAKFNKLPSLSSNIGIYFDSGAKKGTNQKLYADTTGSHNGKTNICWYTFTLSKGTHKFHFYDENHKYGHHSSKPNLDPSKEEWVVSYQYEKDNNYNTPYEVTISEDGDYTFYLQPTWHKDGDYGYYDVDMVKGTHSSGGSDDTPSTTGYKDLYVLDGIVTRYNDAIQDYGTNKFGNSIIVSAKSGVLKYNYYDAVDDELFVRKGDGHDEGHTVYYYDDTTDLDFRVQTTITANHKNIGVRAYVMNGMTYPAKKSKDGVYYADITLDSHSDQGTLEVIPVYYNTLIPEKDYIKFYVDANSIGNNWGKTIGYSIWYQNTGLHGMEGGYPGQPLLSDGNLLYGYFPKYYVGVNDDTLPTVDNRSKFAGVLLTNLAEHNLTHQDVLKAWGVTNNTSNYQTFDYEDPAKIAEIENVDTIEFIAKYQETNANHQTGTHFVSNYSTANNLNGKTSSTWPSSINKPTASDLKGFEVLTDIDGNPVDIYNNKLEGGANFNDAVYVVSVGNQIVTPNQWDTVWMVYTGSSSPTFITAKNPAQFIDVAEGSQSDALKGKTVYINYEKFLDGNAKSDISNSGDRIDGRWVYSRSSDDTTLRLRVATKDADGTLNFNNDFLNWSEISDGYKTGVKESRPSGVTNDNWLLNLENRTTEVTAKINPVGYKVEGFYMLGARYAGADDNGFSSKLSDYDNMNAEGTATSFINARDNRMVIVVSEIPNTDLLITHQMYGGPGSHKIKGFYYLKAELLNSDDTVKATYNNNSTAADGTTNKDISIEDFTAAAPKGQGYKLKITIKTTMSGSATFYQWYENDHNNGYNMLDSDEARGSTDPVTMTKIINVDDLYGDQYLAIKNLDYYSDLQAADSININHLLIGDIQDGQAFNKVTVTDSTGKAIKGGEYSERNRTTVVDSSFITEDNAEAGYQIKVEIWTVPGTNASFDKFYYTDKNEMQTGSYEGIAYTIGEKVIYQNVEYQKATAMVPISYFFKDAPSDDGTTVVKVFDATKKDFNLYSSLNDLSGELIITHQLEDSHTGTANTFITVDLCDNQNNVTKNLISKTDTTNTADHDVKIGKEYIKPGSNDRLKVTLTTEIGDWTDFVRFDRLVNQTVEQLTETSDVETTATVRINNDGPTTMTATILFRIVNLFNPTTKEQRMHRMDFYSVIEQPTFKYDITYKYNAYVASYGEQSYNTSGEITQAELDELMTYDHTELRFINNDTKKKTFISSKAPLEDNFMQTIDYTNFSTAKTSYDSPTHTLEITVTPQTQNSKVNVKLYLPYAHDAQTYDPTSGAIRADGLVTESQAVAEHRTFDCKSLLIGYDNELIKAPLLLYSSSATNNTKHFLYWEVTTQAKQGSTEKTYTRCYDYEFNFAIFQDCIVKPVYDNGGFDAEKMPNPPTTWNMYERFDPYVMRNADKDGAGGINITFMENSRNQYNHNGSGNRETSNGGVPTARQGAADRIYSDFLLSYNNIMGIEKLYEHPGQYKCGVIIEAAGDLDKDSSGKYIIGTEASYKATYQNTEKQQAVTDLIRSNAKSADGRMKSEFDCSALDNKNRTRYYVGLNNRAAASYDASNPPEIGNEYLSTTTRVLRAYAYIYKVGANGAKEDIKISDPTYFTIYNIATVQDGGTYSESNN